MNVICLQDEAFNALIEEVVARIKEKTSITEKKWLTADDAMERLGIKLKNYVTEIPR